MGYETMIAANRIACVCLATLVGAGLLAHQLVPQPALTEWRAANKIACVCLAMLVGAGLLALLLAPQPAIAEWRAAWLTLCGICFVRAVLPLAWVHDGLAAWSGDRAG